MKKCHLAAAIVTAVLLTCVAGVVNAQSITVLPVSIQMQPGQRATSLTIINQGTAESAVQVRAFVWTQVGGEEQLVASGDIVASPPLATIAPGSIQVVRLVLRKAVVGKEATYRILLDQIPPVAAPGTVRIALRLSIPVFALPETRVASRLAFHVERSGGNSFLVAVNTGTAHDTLRDIDLTTSGGTRASAPANTSPYILAGTTRRWDIGSGFVPVPGETVRLSAQTSVTSITEVVPIVIGSP